MTNTSRLWKVLGALLVVSFGILLFMGREIYLAAPPMPTSVKSASGQTLYTRADMDKGREVWQSIGGHQLGSIWGHGSYVAPDWSADWLHREAVGLLDTWATRDYGKPYASLDAATQASLQSKLVPEIRTNTYNPDTGTVVVSEDRAAVIAAVADHYVRLFGDDTSLDTLRAQYAIQRNPIPDAERRHAMTAFFFWSAWSTVTNRPGQKISYTSNWPAEPLVGNVPTAPTFLWTFISIFGLLAGVGALAWYYVATHDKEPAPQVPDSDPLRSLKPTPSMKATAKYFWVVTALILVQVILGGITAHYAVEGQAFYGFQLSDYLPYAVTRTWHLQLAVLWIATAWLATGLYIAPAISGHELPVHLPAGDRRRRARRAVGGRDAEDGPRGQLLVRPPGLGVRRPRPVLAGVPVRRPDAMAAARGPRPVARAQGA
jgi:nitric oxide reductase subunit B